MWQTKNDALYKKFKFQDFDEAYGFIKKVAALARDEDHHPRWQNEWNVVEIWLSTHEPKPGITSKDKDMSKKIDEIYSEMSLDEPVAKNTTGITEVKMFADGGSRGNPGPSASGFALLNMADEVIYKGGSYLGITTNNQAEYRAVKLGLDEALKHGARVVDVYLDSLLVVNQMTGKYKIKNRDLWPIHQSIKEVIAKFEKVKFTHVPRELNKIADGIVNEILDGTDLKEVV